MQIGTLQHFPGLAKLSSVGGNFSLSTSTGPIDFSGLGALETVAGNMVVTANAALDSMNGLDKLSEVGGALTITNNPMLPTAAANAFANRVTVRGAKTISGNHP